jgi:predicted nucleotidyltransferase
MCGSLLSTVPLGIRAEAPCDEEILLVLPVQFVQVAPEHREILQSVADPLREGEAEAVRRLLSWIAAVPVGPFRDETAAPAFLRDRLVARLRPRMVWLFGSRARGDGRENSDFDLLVVLPDGIPETAYSFSAVAEPLIACGLAYDVVPCSWSDFLIERDEPGSLVNSAIREGHILYQDRRLREDSSAVSR